MKPNSVKDKTLHQVRARIPWQTEDELQDSHTRSYMAVPVYQSRLRMLAPATTDGSSLTREFRRTLAKLLKGKERIYDTRSGRAVLRDTGRFIAVRELIKAIGAMVQPTLDQAVAALQRLPELGAKHNGWFKILDSWYARTDFDEVLDSLEQFSRPYALWLEQVRRSSAKTQLMLRSYLDSEFHLNAISENASALMDDLADESPEAQEIALARKEFGRLSKALTPAVRHLAELRFKLFEATGFAFEESRVGRANDAKPYTAWPFPLRLVGNEDAETLAAAVASYQLLGQWMMESGANLRFVEFAEDASHLGMQKPLESAGELEAKECWRNIHMAGEALVYLGAALHGLVRVGSSPHCQLCYRHVGTGFRKYCDLHARPDSAVAHSDRSPSVAIATVHVRTQHRQSKLLAEQFRLQFERLDAALVRKPIWLHPTLTIERAVSRSRRQSGRKPYELGSNCQQRAHDIQAMLESLRPLLGDVLYQRMGALKLEITHWASADSADSARRMESLTLGGFFAYWFSGFSQGLTQGAGAYQGSDVTHPMTDWVLVSSKKFNAPLRRISPMNLDSIVRDLMLHRAWLEVGGEQADAALRVGAAPLPGLQQKGKVDLVAARRMREHDKLSYDAIGEKFGVSRAAVYLALRREEKRDLQHSK